MSLWSFIAHRSCSFLRCLSSIISNILIQPPMGILKKIFRFLCFCFPPDPSYDLLDRAKTAEKKFNEFAEPGDTEAQNELKIAIESYTDLVQLAETHRSNHVDLRQVLTNLAALTWELYQSADGQSPADILQKVIELNEKALDLPEVSENDSFITATLSMNAATAYRERFFKKRNESEDIVKSIKFYKDALGYFNADSPDGVELIMEIGVTYCSWYGRLASLRRWTEKEVKEALRAIKSAYDACERGLHFLPARTTYAHTLALIYCDLVRETVSPGQSSSLPLPPTPPYLNEAITFFSRALETMPEEDPRYPRDLCALAGWLFYRYDHYTTSEADLNQSQDAARKALQDIGALSQDEAESMNIIVKFSPTGASRKDSRRERNILRTLTMGRSRANSAGTADDNRRQPMSDVGDVTAEPLGDEDAT
ncbi:hypothetical protein HYPSUDRAFT_731529 [Hypholoma sublateritium FD-334 SS-4]|uniref:Uncharacterized protein n=1 Tax=Hypholoma sublateritium (strain FD-334 SS-4) TaxID=945553 RepID=A0A0D2NY48_HYPSF|nr:hypothetical protein HYPSUDRAFT_731529 [Hypholoma sublateritium FD-334 SS-4]